MPKKKIVNKTQEVRDYLSRNPSSKPREVAKALSSLGITPGFVSNVKTKYKDSLPRPVSHSLRPYSSARPASGLDAIVSASRFVRECGGPEQAREAIEAAERVREVLGEGD